jgi:dTDP-3-amino-3,4,6-trideoxy-alpha-D-glucose transaminase
VAMTVPFCDLGAARRLYGAASEQALLRVARSGRYVLGAEVAGFEQEWAAFNGAGHAVGVGSGTDALALILRAAGIGPGDEVVVPAYTASATWMAVALCGARPVGADVDPRSGLIDLAAARAAIGSRTAALIGVHLFGRLAPMAGLRDLADGHGLLLVEDAAQAPGAREGELEAGRAADAAAFSFYPTKPLGALGEAGAIVTDDEQLAASVRRLRCYGQGWPLGDASQIGPNSRLDELQAAVLRARLALLPSALARLRSLASRYRAVLERASCLGLPERPDGQEQEPAWHQFVVRHPRRDAVRAEMASRGVGTSVHYEPIPPELTVFGRGGEFPAAAELSRAAISLPFDAWLTDAQADEVCTVASSASSSRSRT